MKKTIILFIVSLAMFMEAVDTTVINTAIPTMATSLAVNVIDLKLTLISYLLSLAVFIPISGWVADRFGPKKIFIVALTLFTLSSIWCAFTNNLWELVLARIIQGLGGALTLPVGRLIIVRICKRHELINKMNLVIMVAAMGMMLGPMLGGYISYHFSWRWIFWLNVPIGILAIILSSFMFPSMPARPIHPLDKLGFILFGTGLSALTFSLSTYSESDIQHRYSTVILIAALFLLFWYVQHSRKKEYPIVKIELLQHRTFSVSVWGNLFARLGFGGIPFLVPLFLQIGVGLNAERSGLLLAPMALGVFLIKPLSFSILKFLGYKKLLIVNTLLVGFSLWLFILIEPSTAYYAIGLLTFYFGFLITLQYTGMNSLAYATISHEDMSAATSVMSTTQQLAQSFGVAVAAILLRLFNTEQVLTVKTFHLTFFTLGLLTLCSIGIFTRLKKDDGQELIIAPSESSEDTH